MEKDLTAKLEADLKKLDKLLPKKNHKEDNIYDEDEESEEENEDEEAKNNPGDAPKKPKKKNLMLLNVNPIEVIVNLFKPNRFKVLMTKYNNASNSLEQPFKYNFSTKYVRL